MTSTRRRRRRRRCSTGRTTTARTRTCSSGRTSSAARRPCGSASRAESTSTTSSCARVVDGEPRNVRAVLDEETETDAWYRATLPARQPVHPLPLAALGRRGRVRVGERARTSSATTCPTRTTSCSRPTRAGPTGISARSSTRSSPTASRRAGSTSRRPPGPSGASWDELPDRARPGTPYELYGGDLPGIEAHLDHVETLGANLLYLTPFFPAGSTHRYDATLVRPRRPAARRRRRARLARRARRTRAGCGSSAT